MRLRLASSALLAACISLAFSSGIALAQTNHRFQRFIHDASDAYQRGDADAAVLALQHAYEIDPVPAILFNIGRAYELALRYQSAIEYYDRFLATNPDAAQAQSARDARATAQHALDERLRTASGSPEPEQATSPHPRSEAQPAGRHLGAAQIALFGTGAAGLVTGALCGIVALTISSNFSTNFDPASRASLQSEGGALAWGADIGLGVGVVAIALGAVLYMLQPAAPPVPAESASPTP